MLLAQISDLHITAPGTLLLGRVDTAAYLRRCIARLAALDLRPDAVIATGDLVDRGTPDEYAALRDLLSPLAIPLYLLIGNHDDRAAFRATFPDPRYAGSDHIQYAVDLGPLRILALDTNVPGAPHGTLCATRLAWLAAELAASHARPVVIAMHHPPFATGIPFMDACALDAASSAALASLIAPYTNIERIICGHLHRPIHTRFSSTIASTAPSCAHQVVLGLLPDTPPALTFEPPAFVQHLYLANRLVSHHTHVDVFDSHPF